MLPDNSLTAAELLQEQDRKLTAEALSFAEQAFSLGCSAVTLPALILAGLALLIWRNWIVAAIVLVIESLLALGLASYVANRANARSSERIYQQSVLPALQAWADANGSDLQQLRQAAADHLPADAPLRRLLQSED